MPLVTTEVGVTSNGVTYERHYQICQKIVSLASYAK